MDYQLLTEQVLALAHQEPWYIPLLSNVSALLYETMDKLNWAGFYLVRDGSLILGPFQGKVACIHIPFGKGVCGTAALENRTLRVADVHQFPGHIACDCASNSEIVLPVHDKDGRVAAVLDIDSPVFSRFDDADQAGLEALVRGLEQCIQW